MGRLLTESKGAHLPMCSEQVVNITGDARQPSGREENKKRRLWDPGDLNMIVTSGNKFNTKWFNNVFLL